MFGKKDAEAAEAIIVESHVKHHGGGDGQSNQREWVADVTPDTGSPFRAVIPLPNLGLDFLEPMVGDTVRVFIDAKTRSVKFDKSDPRVSIKADRARKQAQFEQAAAGPVGSTVTHSGAAANTAATFGIADRLAKLQTLKAAGALTEDEYQSQRQRIIDSI